MRFAEKLKTELKNRNMTQADLHRLTGYSKTCISDWVSAKVEPSLLRKEELAKMLGLEKEHFKDNEIVTANTVFNVPVTVASRLMGIGRVFLEKGLQDGVFPFGWAVYTKQWNYYISSAKFKEYTGIEVERIT